MKTLAILITMTFCSIFCQAQEETKTYNIKVTIDNVLSNKGHVLLGLHNQDTFMKGKGIQNYSEEINDGKVTVTFKDVKPGNYAIMVLHDENDNQRMDFDTSGMPSESYGMSNNPMLYGPPTFNDAKFEVKDQNLEMNIRF